MWSKSLFFKNQLKNQPYGADIVSFCVNGTDGSQPRIEISEKLVRRWRFALYEL